jgi:hypothetical protein
MGLDVGITQGSYWNGSQIPYWLYMVFAILPITGLIGGDHLLLRSPITALLKLLSAIPLFGFWYFYDIAQATGERELVEKYGLGVPFYGPVGIGAGIFINKDTPLSPPDTPRPWRYFAYVLTTALFIVFPINKLVLGDYVGTFAQMLMYIFFPFTFLAIGWGFYDLYRILFDARGVFEEGPSRILPASWIAGPNFDRSVLGPGPSQPPANTWFNRLFYAVAEIPTNTAKATSSVITAAGSATSGVVSAAGVVAKDTIEAADAVSVGLVKKGAEVTSDVMGAVPVVVNKAAEVTTDVMGAVPAVVNTAAEVTADVMGAVPSVVSKAAEVTTDVMGAVPGIVKDVSKSVHNVSAELPKTVDKISNIGVKTIGVVPGIINSVADTSDSILKDVSKSVHNVSTELPKTVDKISNIGVKTIGVVPNTIETVTDQIPKFTKSLVDTSAVLTKSGTSTINKVVEKLPDSDKLIKKAEKAISQSGGAMLSMTPSVSTTVILFSVALLAFGGYVAYTLRNTLTKTKEEDDSPPDTGAVRRTS